MPASTVAALEAYAQGVNAWLAVQSALPPEYGALGLGAVERWSAVDSLVIGKLLAFLLSFELDIGRTVALQSYVAAGGALGFDGIKLFSDDLWRSAGFEPNATVPDASVPGVPLHPHGSGQRGMEAALEGLHGEHTLGLMREYLEQARKVPLLRDILERADRGGSNLWAVSGAFTQHGRPLIANDPHLPLLTLATFFPMGLELRGDPVFGSTLAGIPGVIHGYNSRIAWGTTNNAVDVTDTFSEQVVPDAAGGLWTVHSSGLERLTAIPQTFLVICHKAACVPGSQPRPGSIIARSTAHRPEHAASRPHFAAQARRNFLSLSSACTPPSPPSCAPQS